MYYYSFYWHHPLTVSIEGPIFSGLIDYSFYVFQFPLCIYCRNELISVTEDTT